MTLAEDQKLRRELLPNGAVWGRNAYAGEMDKRCGRCAHLVHLSTACAVCGCKPAYDSKRGGPR